MGEPQAPTRPPADDEPELNLNEALDIVAPEGESYSALLREMVDGIPQEKYKTPVASRVNRYKDNPREARQSVVDLLRIIYGKTFRDGPHGANTRKLQQLQEKATAMDVIWKSDDHTDVN